MQLLELGISTTNHSLLDLEKLNKRNEVDFLELGISTMTDAEKMLDQLGRSTFRTIHCLPFLKNSERNFMLNPCRRPIEAAEMATRMMHRAKAIGLSYQLYSVHAGLLGEIPSPKEFTVTDRIGVEEGIENLKVFRKELAETEKIIVENIYGWNKDSQALGMTYSELKEMNEIFPLLLDLGHAAVNYELFLKRRLDELNMDSLDIKEIHISFLKPGGPPPWDHCSYLKNKVNQRIIRKLEEALETRTQILVVLEIDAPYEAVAENIKLLRDRLG